jgi:8-oxo-dGTP pyrophosphatase MutT (NUDIX family)
VHVDESVLAPLRARYGEPDILRWAGEVTEAEWNLATYNPERTHDFTLYIFNGDRLALIRKPHFTPSVWRPPGGGVKPGEDVATGAVREAYEETGLHVEVDAYLVDAQVTFTWEGRELAWRTHVLSAITTDEEIDPQDPEEIAAARWGTLEELQGPVREALLATGRALWRYRVALHDASAVALERISERPRG